MKHMVIFWEEFSITHENSDSKYNYFQFGVKNYKFTCDHEANYLFYDIHKSCYELQQIYI